LVHIDIWGPFFVPSYSGYRFFLTIVDDYTRFTWLFLMKSKSETRAILTNFLAYVNTHFNIDIQTLRSNNGQVFNMLIFFIKSMASFINYLVSKHLNKMEGLRENINTY